MERDTAFALETGLPGSGESTLPPAHGAWAVLSVFRHRNYRLFLSGQLVSVIGTWVTNVAQGYLVYSLTGSPFLLGLVAFAGHAPVLLCSPLGGMVSDRVERRRALLVTQALAGAQSAALAALTLTGVIQVWHIVCLALFQGLVNAFDIPIRQAMTMEMVGRRDLRLAISLNSMTFNLARLFGPMLAGITIAMVGVGACFALDAVSYLAVLAGLSRMQPMPQRERRHVHPVRAIRQGFVYAWRRREIRLALFLIASCSAFGGSYVTFLPAVARSILHQGSIGLGVLYGAVGAGALCGAYTLTRIPDRLLAHVPRLGALSLGLSLLALSQSRLFWLSVLLTFPCAYSLMLLGGATNSIVQLRAHDSMRGRVMALYAMSFMGMTPFGALVLGGLAEHAGTGTAIAAGGSVCVVAALAAWAGVRKA